MVDKIISEFGLDEVSKRTKISKRNLEKLAKRELSSFSKPRALGFISIMEREYGVDLTDFKKEILEWFQNEDVHDHSLTFPPPKEKRKKRWVAIVPLLIALIFGFYLYQNDFSINKSLQESKVVSTVIKEKKVEKRIEDINSSKVKQEVKTTLSLDDNGSSTTDNKTFANSLDKDIKNSDDNSTESAFVPTQEIIVMPNIKMWIGVIDIKSKKRKSHFISENFSIDSDSDKLIITGHGFFEVNDTIGNNLKFDDPNKHYLQIKDGVIKEITTKTFKELNGGKVW